MKIAGSFTLCCLWLVKVISAKALHERHDNYVIHEARDPGQALKLQRRDEGLPRDTRVPLRIALRQQNLENGMDLIMDISDPKSSRYGNHYTATQVAKLFAPKDESIKVVKEWLEQAGIPAENITISKSKAWMNVESTVGQLEPILRTKYQTYGHSRRSNVEYVAVDDYSLPEHVSQHVDFLIPGVSAASRHTTGGEASSTAGARRAVVVDNHKVVGNVDAESAEDCYNIVTPACIRTKYDIPLGELKQAGNQMGFFEADNYPPAYQRYNQTDLNTFYNAIGSPHIPQGFAPKNLYINATANVNTTFDQSGEANLDLMIAIPIIYPQQAVVFQTGVPAGDLFNSFLDGIDGSYCDSGVKPENCGKFKPTSVISFSYASVEYGFSAKYMERQCNEFMKLGLQGVTIVTSSGDSGVANRGGVCLGPKKNIFTPMAAPSCPYITAVGGTSVPYQGTIADLEVASTTFSSGGGFSNIFKRAPYQEDAVTNYLQHYKPNYTSYATSEGNIPNNTSGIYNRIGRGFPDISALAQNGFTVDYGRNSSTQGTSMSTPLVGAMFNRINEERLKVGKKPIGFVNPTLYQNPHMFNDVLNGTQALGGTADFFPSACGNTGFSCSPGWDPVTGLGTPRYPDMLKVFMDLP